MLQPWLAMSRKVRHLLSQFGAVLKEGPSEDHNNREKIAKLRFASSTSESSEPTVV